MTTNKLQLSVDIKKIVRKVEPRIIGINTNYVTDHAEARKAGQGYLAALKQMGVKSLRYPGGEKSDSFLWAAPPDFKEPKPSLARVGGFPGSEWPSPIKDWVQDDKKTFVHQCLDFDEFMELCQATGAEPIICVCFDAMYKPAPAGGWSADKALLIKNAVEWVRYANLTKKYKIRYWELGNESYLNTYNGGTRGAQYAKDFVDFAKAMKAVDPTILIGANGPHRKDAPGQLDRAHGTFWWEDLLKGAAKEIDWLTVHPYPCWEWGSYDWYRLKPYDFTEAARGAIEALKAWAPSEAGRIRVNATELNSADWSSGGWHFLNNLGHALVLFDILGEHLHMPEIDFAEVWNTRWTQPEPHSLWDSLGTKNELRPTGDMLALWSRFLKDDMVEVKSAGCVKGFASSGKDGSLSVFLINKELHPQPISLSLNSSRAKARSHIYAGKGPDDQAPLLRDGAAVELKDGALSLTLDPVSLTVLEL